MDNVTHRDLDGAARERRADEATEQVERLRAAGVHGVACTFVDNSGITRVKTVPVAALPRAAAWGVGMSPVFDAFRLDDMIMSGSYAGRPIGDLRLHPDISRLTVLAGQPGWAWAPVDRYEQGGAEHPQCSRLLAARQVARLTERGLTARMAVEVEWALSIGTGDDFVPACQGPAYGMTRLGELSDYSAAILDALAQQGVSVDQFHPEYAAGQLEVSVAAEDPVSAADTFVLVRETVRAVSRSHGFRATFSPKVLAEGVGNGAHVHLSIADERGNLMTGGPEPHGLGGTGAAFAAGILARLPALSAIGAPSVASYLRLVPSHWAGAFACWGLENRETALRLVTGSTDDRDRSANLEVKCFDATANPYLVVSALIAAGLAGIDEQSVLPDPVDVDPAGLSEADRGAAGITALPTSATAAGAALRADAGLTEALGTELVTTLVELRGYEAELFAGSSPEEVAAATRWKH